MKTIRSMVFLLAWMAVSVALADIDVKAVYAPHEPITATVLTSDVPTGALLRGSFQCKTAKFESAGVPNVYHVWAAPGKHELIAKGIWVVTDTGALGGALKDFGTYEYSKEFVVGGDAPPVPPPVPPTPPGDRRVVILEETEQKTPAQAILWQQLLAEFKDLQILDDDQPSAQPYLTMVAPNVRPALLVLAGDKLVRAVPAPSTVDAVKQEVAR